MPATKLLSTENFIKNSYTLLDRTIQEMINQSRIAYTKASAALPAPTRSVARHAPTQNTDYVQKSFGIMWDEQYSFIFK